MNKVSRLAALLLAVLCFAFAGCALAEEGETVQYTGTETGVSLDDILAAQDIAVTNLYNTLLGLTTLQDMYDNMFTQTNWELLNAMNAEQLQGLYNHANDIFYAIENPTEDEIDLHRDITDTFLIIAEGMEIELLADDPWVDDYTITGDKTIDGLITIANNDTGGEANWTFKNGTLTINKTVTIPNGQSLDILVSTDDTDHTATIKAGSGLGNDPMFIVGGQLKIAHDNSDKQNHGSITIEGGTIQVNNNGSLRMNEIQSIAGNVNVTLGGSNAGMYISGDMPVDGTLRISGNGKIERENPYTNLGYYTGEMFVVHGSGSLNIEGTTATSRIIIDGKSIENVDSLIHTYGNLNLKNVTLQNNYVIGDKDTRQDYRGGAIFIDGATTASHTVNLENCKIDNCKAVDASAVYLSGNGGAIVNIKKTIVEDCQAINLDIGDTYGGAIRTNGGGKYQTLLQDCIFRNNSSFNLGGCVYWNASGSGSKLTIEDCQIYGNTATSRGGGIFLEGSNTEIKASGGIPTAKIEGDYYGDITGTLITENESEMGGGVCFKTYANDKSIQILNTYVKFSENVVITDNEAVVGAGVAFGLFDTHNYPNGSTFIFEIDGATITDNEATGEGGGIYVYKEREDYIVDVLFKSGLVEDNTATNGGAIAVTAATAVTTGGNFTMSGGILKNNTANGNGGGIYLTKGNYTMSGGTVENNHAVNGGASYVTGGDFAMSGGTMSSNYATTNGGAVYVTGGGFTMNDGTVSSNRAVTGGAVYVNGGAFTMNDGEMTGNGKNGDTVVAENGGAVYVTGNGAKFTMNNGAISNNEATSKGGAAYVAGGDFIMSDGTMSGNKALNGGAVYADGGNVTMTSGTLSSNTAWEKTTGAAEEGTEGYGGAIFANGGNVTIGVENCSGVKVGSDYHNVTEYKEKKHPIITGNEAVFGGALAVRGNGEVVIYCSDIAENKSANDGTGMNVFMDSEDAKIDHYLDNAKIGENENHGMVSIGGQLTIHHGVNAQFTVTITYDSNYNNEKVTDVEWTGTAPENYYLNLPYCPTNWVTTQEKENLTFVGWADTEQGTVASEIRMVPDYMPIGTPVKLIDQTPEESPENKDMKFYAVWAPKNNRIFYRYSLDGVKIEEEALAYNGPDYYEFARVGAQVPIGIPTKSGYAFKGWRLYAENEKISNWDADAKKYKPDTITDIKTYADYATYNGTTDYKEFIDPNSYLLNNTLVTEQNFGELTLVAVFEPMFSTLKITKAISGTAEENATFLFHVTGTPDDEGLGYNANNPYSMYVTVNGASTTTIEEIPVGDYTVTEISDWSWRYSTDDSYSNYKISDPDKTYEVTFTNGDRKVKWLDGEAEAKENQFTIKPTPTPAASPSPEP